MSYSVKTLLSFEKQAKRLVKKYPSLKAELKQFMAFISANPEQGSPLGNHCYKIRLSIASKGRGKSGGARIITHLVVKEEVVYLVSIYDKSEIPSLSGNDIEALLKQIQ